jgi:hypothetical protein
MVLVQSLFKAKSERFLVGTAYRTSKIYNFITQIIKPVIIFIRNIMLLEANRQHRIVQWNLELFGPFLFGTL